MVGFGRRLRSFLGKLLVVERIADVVVRRSGPAAEVHRREGRAALRAGYPLGDPLDHLERSVAVRAAAVTPVGACVRQIDHTQLLAGVTERQATPVASPPGLSPPHPQLAGGVVAGGTAVLDERSHVRPGRYNRVASAVK